MAKFVELMNTKSDRERYRLMLFVNIVLKEYEKSTNKDNTYNFKQSQPS